MSASETERAQKERQKVKDLTEINKIKKGDTWYPIDYRWFKTWKDYTLFDAKEPLDFSRAGARPLEIDNTDIVDAENPTKLKPGMQEHYHFELVHSSVWEKLHMWYGGGPALPREVIGRGTIGMELEVVELYPFAITVFPAKEGGEPDVENKSTILVSTKETLNKIITEVKNKDKDWSSDYRLWIESENESKEKVWSLLPKDQLKKNLEEMELIGETRILVDKKSVNGEWLKTYVEPEWRPFLKKDDLVDALDKTNKWYESKVLDVKENEVFIHYNGWADRWDEWIPKDSDRLAQVHTHTTGPYVKQSYGGFSGGGGYYGGGWYSMASSEEGIPTQKGIVGLRNLGNTCFMNSTLQCLTATEAMREYWLQDKYATEINRDNVLGWKGKVAEEYASLVKEIWSGKYKIVVPRNFKTAIGEFAPRFSGYEQQDSSELLSFLLDGIHEDLNRVVKKPYTEAVESKGRDDEIVAAEAWETHRKRHDSIIVDNFQGLLKSRVVCPSCEKVSVTFDPFMFLSVPLPTNQDKFVEVNLIAHDPSKQVKAISVKVHQMGTVMDLKLAISKASGIPVQRLVVGEIWKGRVYKFFPNNHLMGDIRGNDETWAWEVPSMDDMKEQKENDRNLDYDFAQLLTVITKEETEFMGGKRLAAEPFGVPFPLLVSSKGKMPGRELRKNIENLIAPWVVPSEDGSVPYVLRSLDWGGRTAKDIIPDDDTLVDVDRVAFAVDFVDTTKYRKERLKAGEEGEVESPTSRAVGGKQRDKIELASCIAAYTEEETLTEQNAWHCPTCKDFKCAKKKFDLWSVPRVLVIHLKRFQYSRMYRDKIDSFVDFPINGLDMTPYVIGGQSHGGKQLIYDCYAISNHFGGLGGGHYTAYVKSSVDGNWYDMDDSSTSQVNPAQLKTPAAYVLFYQLRED
eukprot:TRINITY_DN4121_c0_g1_i1.p1 TRINITY_DN4121_c0_g1~~TRINITY_DN4121_c0_g1_i1.p1  ORF type:complete len:912 (-),score=279.12 TRINITY_DN4121_c0_g1_i1:98-2833(-)